MSKRHGKKEILLQGREKSCSAPFAFNSLSGVSGCNIMFKASAKVMEPGALPFQSFWQGSGFDSPEQGPGSKGFNIVDHNIVVRSSSREDADVVYTHCETHEVAIS